MNYVVLKGYAVAFDPLINYIDNGYGADTTNERTVRFWFARFRRGNYTLDNEPRR